MSKTSFLTLNSIRNSSKCNLQRIRLSYKRGVKMTTGLILPKHGEIHILENLAGQKDVVPHLVRLTVRVYKSHIQPDQQLVIKRRSLVDLEPLTGVPV